MKSYWYTTSALVMALLSAASGEAQIIESVGLGSDLDGATVTVHYFGAAPQSATIFAMGGEQGMALAPGWFEFQVTGDTFLNDWELTNLSPNPSIALIEFDLPPSISLFDDDSLPSTPDSVRGVLGAQWISGPVPINSFELVPYVTPPNLGDMFLAEDIEFAPSVFFPGATFVWHDDTDLVPEPTTGLMLGIALVALMARRR